MHVPTATLIGLVLAALPIAAIGGIVWITRLAARPIRPVPLRGRPPAVPAEPDVRLSWESRPRRRSGSPPSR